jgi:hypothetical protein
MSKEKVMRLQKYATDLKNKLEAPTPEKHKASPKNYKQFLERELQAVTRKIADLALVATK